MQRKLRMFLLALALAAVTLVLPQGAMGEDPAAFASIRVVREAAGEPGKPKITLPEGYTLETGGNYEVASPGEYYVFLRGPKGVARGVRIEWPGVKVRAVIHNHSLLPLRREGEAVLCDVPVTAASLRAAWGTLEVWTSLSENSLPIRIEHNNPDRRAGKYAQGPWPEAQNAARLNFLFAARQMMRDWGLHRDVAREKRGSISLMSSENNNPLHGDWPMHWHLIFYPLLPDGRSSSEAPGSCVPHFYMDDKGRVIANQYGVFGRPELAKRYVAGEPVAFNDTAGKAVLALMIRPDGGVDIGPEIGQWTYSILPGGEDGSCAGSVRILKRGSPWVRVTVRDDTAAGVLTVGTEPLDNSGKPVTETWRYDPLTGVPLPQPK